MSRLRDGEVLAHLEYDLRGADCDGRRRLRSTSAAKFILGCAELLIAAGNDSVVPGSVREILYSVSQSVCWSVGNDTTVFLYAPFKKNFFNGITFKANNNTQIECNARHVDQDDRHSVTWTMTNGLCTIYGRKIDTTYLTFF